MREVYNDKNSEGSELKKPLHGNIFLYDDESINSYVERLLKSNEEIHGSRRAALNALEDAILSKETLQIHEERMSAQKEALQAAVNGAALKESLNILAQIVIKEKKAEVRTAFYIADPNGTHLHPVMGAGNMSESYLKEIDGCIIAEDSLAGGLAIASGRPILTTDVFEEPLWKSWIDIAKKYDYRGCWSFPIKSRDDKAIGIFAMYFQTPHKASPKDLELADMITKTAAMIISSKTETEERAKAEKELHANEEKYRKELQLEVQKRTEEIVKLNAELKHLNTITANNYTESLRQVYIHLETIVTTDARALSNSSRANLRRAQAAIQKMKLLSNDINSYLQLYDFEITKETIHPNNILQNVIESLQKKIEEESAKIKIEKLPSLQADPLLFSKLMTHLIDNSIKFHKENAAPVINITYSIIDHVVDHKLLQEKPFIVISVSDEGIGFEKTETIFEPFTLLHDHGKHKGAGMGLAICKKIMAMHGGFITADSAPDDGATFNCYFPA